jgi:uncharacterized protein (DUF433 family)
MAVVRNTHIEIVNGEPRIVGTRFGVDHVAAMYILGESSVDWIVENYPLTRAQVHAALAYYYDHQAEIERLWREAEELAHQVAAPSGEVIARMRARVQRKQDEP